MADCLLTYVTKYMMDIGFKVISVKHEIVNFKKLLPTVALTSNTL